MKNLIFLDTETTGNEIGKDRLCQVCYKVNGEIKTSYFKPPLPISVKAMSITHITNKTVVDKEVFTESEMFKELQTLLKDGVLVAHNAKFDLAMLEAEGLAVNKFICTLRVARYLDEENKIPEYNLQFLRYFLDLDVVGDGKAHDAEADVNSLYALFERLLSKIKEKISDEEKAIEKMIEISKNPVIFKKFNFGKYKDKTVQSVALDDRRYLEWLLKTKMEDGGQDEDWIYTLKQYLSL
jgi:DNA polymerase III epsilon subunit-like protein